MVLVKWLFILEATKGPLPGLALAVHPPRSPHGRPRRNPHTSHQKFSHGD